MLARLLPLGAYSLLQPHGEEGSNEYGELGDAGSNAKELEGGGNDLEGLKDGANDLEGHKDGGSLDLGTLGFSHLEI